MKWRDVAASTIRQHRERCSMTMRDVRDETGLGLTTIFKIEDGQRSPSMETMIVLADLFNVSLDDLIGRKP